MEKVKDMLHMGHKKEDDMAPKTTPDGGMGGGQPGMGMAAEPTEKKGMFGGMMGGHHKDGAEGGKKKKGGIMGMGGGSSSSSSSDEEREGAKERNRLRREKRAQRKMGAAAGTTEGMDPGTMPMPTEEGADKKKGFFGH